MKRINTSIPLKNFFKSVLFASMITFGLTACLPGAPVTRVVSQPTFDPTPAIQPALTQEASREGQVEQVEIQTAVGITVVPAVRSDTGGPGCTDAAKFLADVSIPDNSLIASNAPFVKTWRLMNTGTCTWDNSYLVHYISGATMTQSPGYWIVGAGQTVAPGQVVDISVGMTSPVENGVYQSYWGLKKEHGQWIPIQGGANGNSFYVKIQVNNGTAGGHVTDAAIDIELEQGSGIACTPDSTYFVQADITADGPTSAFYEIASTAGQIAAGNFESSPGSGLSPFVTGTLVFDRADTKRIALRFVGPYPYPDDITVTLRVNGGEFHQAKVSCQ